MERHFIDRPALTISEDALLRRRDGYVLSFVGLTNNVKKAQWGEIVPNRLTQFEVEKELCRSGLYMNTDTIKSIE